MPIKTADEIPIAAELDGVQFSIGYDDRSLCARWNVAAQHGPLKNSGEDFHRYFKTGACLDLQLGTDAAAPANRTSPAAGDLRLLFTMANDKPQAVLYQPIVDGADLKDAWETRTDAGGTTRFARVIRLASAKLDYQLNRKNPDGGYSLTALIPLRDLQWQPKPGQTLRCDWGILSSDDGHTVKRRSYWSNVLATGTTDEAWEARLEPHLWGTLFVTEKSQADEQLEKSLKGETKPSESADIVDDILNADESKERVR